MRKIDWLYPSAYALPTPGDGSCYFHAISQALGQSYQYSYQLRRELAQKLSFTDVYEQLSQGELKKLGTDIHQYSKEGLISMLLSMGPVDYSIHELTSNHLNKDIYIISEEYKQLINLSNHELFYKGRDSIVILHTGFHFETIAIKQQEQLITLFSPDDNFIRAITNKYSWVR